MLSHLQKSKIFVENKQQKQTVDCGSKHKNHTLFFFIDMFFFCPHEQRIITVG